MTSHVLLILHESKCSFSIKHYVRVGSQAMSIGVFVSCTGSQDCAFGSEGVRWAPLA